MTHLDHNTEEFGVDGTVVTLVCISSDSHILETLLLLGGRAEHVAKFRGANAAKTHPLLRLLALARVQHFCLILAGNGKLSMRKQVTVLILYA
jgi:hypothetical protein